MVVDEPPLKGAFGVGHGTDVSLASTPPSHRSTVLSETCTPSYFNVTVCLPEVTTSFSVYWRSIVTIMSCVCVCVCVCVRARIVVVVVGVVVVATTRLFG